MVPLHPKINVLIKGEEGTISYPLTPDEYVLKDVGEENADKFCEQGLGILDIPGKKWILGDTFLRRYYSIYDWCVAITYILG